MKLAGCMLLGVLQGSVLLLPFVALGLVPFFNGDFTGLTPFIVFTGWQAMTGLPVAMAVWAVMGGERIIWRAIGAMASFTLLVYLSRAFLSGAAAGVFIHCQLLLFFWGVPLLVLRVMGVRLRRMSPDEIAAPSVDAAEAVDEDDDEEEPWSELFGETEDRAEDETEDEAEDAIEWRGPKLQFTIGSALSWTAGFAVFMSFVSTAELAFDNRVPWRLFSFDTAVQIVYLGVFVSALLCAFFGRGRVLARCVAIGVCLLMLMLPAAIFGGLRGIEGPGIIVFSAISAAAGMACAAGIFRPARQAGYRLVFESPAW